MPWFPFGGGNNNGTGEGISSGSGFGEHTSSGSGIGNGRSSGSGIEEGTLTSNGIRGGTSHGVKFKKDNPCQKKVRLGKNFLLIDRNLRQNLQTIDAFQFLHLHSLSVVKVQPKRPFEIDMQVDMSDVPNIEVQPSTTFSCDNPPPSASFPVSQAPEEHLPAQHYLEEQLLAQDSLEEQLPVLNFNPIVHFCVGGSKRVQAPRITRVHTLRHCFSRPKEPNALSATVGDLFHGPIHGIHKRVLPIEDNVNNPSLFRSPQR